jgi:hypothetical protein
VMTSITPAPRCNRCTGPSAACTDEKPSRHDRANGVNAVNASCVE